MTTEAAYSVRKYADMYRRIGRAELRPIWRGEPNHGSGVAAIALDPREAEHVLEHGCLLDGETFTASLEGFRGVPEGDGRISVRITKVAL